MTADRDPPEPATDASDLDVPPLGPSSIVPIDSADPLAGLHQGLAPQVPEVVREVRRNRAREALFGRPVARQFGRYIVLGELGHGGMGTVLTAYDPQLDRKVALKLLRDPKAARSAARLEREAKALAKLSHPNVVQVYEVGLEDEQRFVAMELVQGQTLQQWQSERRPWKECVQVYLQAGRGLAAAHAKGLVHRDFKPGNCILDDEGRVRVLDFGLVYGGDESALDAATREAVTVSQGTERSPSELTETGTVLGTPAYMPPEQLEGREADARSDQFSFCVALYEAVYGERPFEGGSVAALIESMQRGVVRPAPKGTTVPAALRKVVLRGLAIDPEQRWPSMEALLEQLRRLVTPRGRRWMALGLGLAGVGVAIGQYAEVARRCEGARAQLEGVWDDARRQQVQHSILDTKLSYAPDTWERVEPRLDDYAEAWASKHTEVCEATSVRQEQSAEVMDLRMGCLRDRRVALREVVAALTEANDSRVEKAVTLVAGLPRLARCDDVSALQAELPPPEDPDVAQQVEAQRERLQRGRSLHNTGDYGDALEVSENVMRQAEALGYVPLLADAALRVGIARSNMGQYTAAEHDLEQAYSLAAQHGYAMVEVEALGHLTVVVGLRLGRPEEGLWLGKMALPIARGPEIEPHVEAALLQGIGLVLKADADYEGALTHYRQALAITEDADGSDHPKVASLLSSIGNVLGLQDDFDDALIHHQRALAIKEVALGPSHPSVAFELNNIGMDLRLQGNLAESLARFQQALAVWEPALGPEHPLVALVLNNIGIVARKQGDLVGALSYLQRALAIREQSLGPNHPDVATSLDDVGIVLAKQNELEEALAYHGRALAIRERSLGPDHPETAHALANAGIVLRRKGELGQALLHFQRALAILEKTLGSDHVDVAKLHNNIGILMVDQDRIDDAMTHHQRALAILEAALGPDHPDVANALAGLGEALVALDEPAAALAHLERAHTLRTTHDVDPAELAEARFVLARALWSAPAARGRDRPRARTLAEQARDAYAALGETQKTELAEVQAWLAEHRLP